MKPLHLLFAVSLLAGCKAPTVHLATPEPIVVDVNMRVDIYQRGGAVSGAPKPLPDTGDVPAADARRRSRMGDIQAFKNSRLVGENHLGSLVVLEQPEGSYGRYVARVVAEENADRAVIMRQLAAERSMSLEDVQRQQGDLWRNRSFSGEWVEAPEDNGRWRWVQKE